MQALFHRLPRTPSRGTHWHGTVALLPSYEHIAAEYDVKPPYSGVVRTGSDESLPHDRRRYAPVRCRWAETERRMESGRLMRRFDFHRLPVADIPPSLAVKSYDLFAIQISETCTLTSCCWNGRIFRCRWRGTGDADRARS